MKIAQNINIKKLIFNINNKILLYIINLLNKYNYNLIFFKILHYRYLMINNSIIY